MRTISVGALALTMAFPVLGAGQGSAVVTNGRFTNIYVYPDPSAETWEQHMARLRPTDAGQFSRAAIDHFTATLMAPEWPSYFDALSQYSGIHPPRFFGSAAVSQACVDAALRDLHAGVMQWSTVRSLANCHVAGHDPSPQVNLIFSPDIKLATINSGIGPGANGADMCTTTSTGAWHAWGVNVPNLTAIPTDPHCTADFTALTGALSHEIVELLADPAGMGFGVFGSREVADLCEDRSDRFTTWSGFSVARYWSNADQNCEPRLDPPAGSKSVTWVLGEGAPLRRFTGSVHDLTMRVPDGRELADATVTQVILVAQTGSDDLRGGNDNADAILSFIGGNEVRTNINGGRRWGNGETHAVQLPLPARPVKVADLTGLTIMTHFGGGIGGDNWNLDRVALVVSFDANAPTHGGTPIVVHDWADASGAPLVRFTGQVHDFSISVNAQDVGQPARALQLVLSTGNDDLRGGRNPGDNCDVTIVLRNGRTMHLENVNQGAKWDNWTTHTVDVPLPAGGIRGGEIASIQIHTGFGGGIGGDNWNLQRVQLKATL